ncbi:LOW QUALITY PROTEIN: hypothetical protein PanWU01x14_092870 [Parasponia andersonii]|uniref:Uncharacterized protein n=1 Tax=Parasponia andersonii TaxID=3476 RepID=A0A2P5D6N6_PARAD|nr:LOW QUALITY PROTEIN: hypothetical protein PanWU01x14_092870 [Parasponia andersonii]
MFLLFLNHSLESSTGKFSLQAIDFVALISLAHSIKFSIKCQSIRNNLEELINSLILSRWSPSSRAITSLADVLTFLSVESF